MRRSIQTAAIAAASAALAACGIHRAENAGPDTSRAFPVGNFSSIEVVEAERSERTSVVRPDLVRHAEVRLALFFVGAFHPHPFVAQTGPMPAAIDVSSVSMAAQRQQIPYSCPNFCASSKLISVFVLNLLTAPGA